MSATDDIREAAVAFMLELAQDRDEDGDIIAENEVLIEAVSDMLADPEELQAFMDEIGDGEDFAEVHSFGQWSGPFEGERGGTYWISPSGEKSYTAPATPSEPKDKPDEPKTPQTDPERVKTIREAAGKEFDAPEYQYPTDTAIGDQKINLRHEKRHDRQSSSDHGEFVDVLAGLASGNLVDHEEGVKFAREHLTKLLAENPGYMEYPAWLGRPGDPIPKGRDIRKQAGSLHRDLEKAANQRYRLDEQIEEAHDHAREAASQLEQGNRTQAAASLSRANRIYAKYGIQPPWNSVKFSEEVHAFADPAKLPTDQVALAGPDGRRAAELLADAKARGSLILNHLAERALTRLLKEKNPTKAKTFFDEDETQALADALAAVNATADLLARSRIRERAQQAILTEEQAIQFSDDDSWQMFADPPAPLPPERAIDYFSKLVPQLGRLKETDFAAGMIREAFTLAAATDEILLGRVKDLITDRLKTGQAGGAQAIQAILDDAGVSPRNSAYADCVWRSNAMSSYNRGAMEELQEVEDTFPVWRYAGVLDGRQGSDHEPKFDKYYPTSATFEEVRGDRPFNCRCTLIPISKFRWAKLQSEGARVETDW